MRFTNIKVEYRVCHYDFAHALYYASYPPKNLHKLSRKVAWNLMRQALAEKGHQLCTVIKDGTNLLEEDFGDHDPDMENDELVNLYQERVLELFPELRL